MKKINKLEVKAVEKQQLKSLEIIEDYQEKFNIIAKQYYDGLRGWDDTPKDREYRDKHIIGSTIVLKTKEGYILTIDAKKPTINNTIYYDDETEAPTIKYETFESYNIFYNLHSQRILKDATKLFKSRLENNFCEVSKSSYGYYEENFIRILTDDEKDDLNVIYKKLETDYKKRLATYWKRYADKVTTYGYWANR